MLSTRRLVSSLATVLALSAAAGCGHNVAPTAAPAATSATAQVFKAAGETRKFGYDTERYQHVLKALAHPVHLDRRAKLPTSVDNRQYCPPVYNQGALGSCTAFSMGKGLREYMQRKNGEQQVPLSARWLYYYEREHMGAEYINKDSGANMADGMWVLENKGDATENFWPYIPNAFTDKPDARSDASATAWKIKKSVELASFDDVKTALADGKPVAFGFTVYLRFQFIGADGKMSMPWKFEPKMGGHAVLAVGYDDEKQSLIVRNSWGNTWGDKGYFYMPYAFAKDSTKAMEWFTAE